MVAEAIMVMAGTDMIKVQAKLWSGARPKGFSERESNRQDDPLSKSGVAVDALSESLKHRERFSYHSPSDRD